MSRMSVYAIMFAGLLGVAVAQHAGKVTAEVHPKLTTQMCTKAGGCQVEHGSIVLDANWRWLNPVGSYGNCYKGNQWNKTVCPDPESCAKACALEGAAYNTSYGINTDGDKLSLRFVTKTKYGKSVGSRVYLMDSQDKGYKKFNMKNAEMSFTVDLSTLACGLNGALYFVEMDADGGMSKHPMNKAGAKYGTGYCDAQCPQDIKFINGLANLKDWTPWSNNSGNGHYGACCAEMDVWEANRMSTSYTAHVCNVTGHYMCEGIACGGNGTHKKVRYEGVCDKDGCDFNPFRMGVHKFFGNGSEFVIDSTRPFTVVTQWITNDGTADGELIDIKRIFVQDGKQHENPAANIPGIPAIDSITEKFCKGQKKGFGDVNAFDRLGGLKSMGESMGRGMVLVLSLWDDHEAEMLWLDSTYPVNATKPGAWRGNCPTTSGHRSVVEKDFGNATVYFSDMKFGEIGSTF